MKYYLINGEKGYQMADKAINSMLEECSRQLFNFTRDEFDSIVEYDVLNIMAYFYTKMNAQQKTVIVDAIQEELGLLLLDDTLENLAEFASAGIYIPFSCKLLIDRLDDELFGKREIMIVYETIFKCCAKLTKNHWNQNDSYSNYLVLLNVAYFTALSYNLHVNYSDNKCSTGR